MDPNISVIKRLWCNILFWYACVQFGLDVCSLFLKNRKHLTFNLRNLNSSKQHFSQKKNPHISFKFSPFRELNEMSSLFFV